MLSSYPHEVKQLVNISKERGDIQRKKHQKLRLVLNPPSIPTSFQTFRYSDSETKAFGTSSSRFQDNGTDLPGPGYYKASQATLEASLSTNGFGNGFASKKKRFNKFSTAHDVSPGQYKVQAPVKVSNLVSAAFKAHIVPQEVRLSALIQPTKTPAPGQYDPHIQKTVKTYREGVENSVFKSKTARITTLNHESPSPNSYNPQINSTPKHAGAVASFKAEARNSRTVHETPGPSNYTIDQAGNLTMKPRYALNLKYSPRRVVKSISKYSRPDSRAENPFDQSYEESRPRTEKMHGLHTSYIAEKIGPMPGRYNIARAAESVKTAIVAPRSIFNSKTSRFSQIQTTTHMLGPGFYQPIKEVTNRSFHLNLGGHWL